MKSDNLDHDFNDIATDYVDEAPGEMFDQDDEVERMNMVNAISSMQNMGLSKDDQHYDENELENYPIEELKSCYDRVMGDVSEEVDEPKPKPTKPKHHLDDLDDILNPRSADLPTNYDEPAGAGSVTGDDPMNLPTASRDATRAKMQNMSPSDTMRDYMNRINPMAGATEPELPDTPTTDIALRTASDVPAVISSAMQATGMQSPEWHTIDNLPGFQNRNIRGIGRSVFSMFTSTPIESIKTIANVGGQGPNTDAELRAVAGWLQNNAEDLGEVEVGFGMAIPGYKPDVKEFKANGIRFHVVRDPMGQYIYAYPDADARSHGQSVQGREQGQRLGGGNMPKLRESTAVVLFRPTLMEQLKWDEELAEAYIEESSLSKLIGQEKGGQKLVGWLHKKHKLGNDVDLKPAPFNQRLLWKEYKRNPDNFIIVAGSDGVAGIKPYEKYIKDRTAAFAKKGKVYDPGGDSTLPYQIIAFTDDGEQVDPALLRPAPEGDEERYADPTVMKARMGLHTGKDTQNPDNVFNLLADQIGKLQTVFITGGEEPGKFSGKGVERDKMQKRADMKAGDKAMPEHEAMQKIFDRVRPVLKTLANQALSQINRSAQRYITGGNFEAAQKVAGSGHKLKQFLINLDKSGAITLNTTPELHRSIMDAIQNASGSRLGSDAFKEYLNSAAKGNAVALKPILDALRDKLPTL